MLHTTVVDKSVHLSYYDPMKQWICSQCGEPTNQQSCQSCQRSSLLQGRYALQECLGQGGNAETWKAFDQQAQQWVAIKEMPWRIQDGSKTQQRFFRESDFLRQMNHESIPTYFAHFITKNGRHSTLHIVQQYIDGQSLFQEMQHQRYTQKEVWMMAEELLILLQYIHGLAPAIIHRDIKPSNIIRNQQGSLILIDFGSARDILTEAGLGASTISGTFGYMSPEQIQGYATPQSDLYSVGAFLVHLLTRRDPSSLTDHRLQIHWKEHCALSTDFSTFLDLLIAADSTERLQSATIALSLLRHAQVQEKKQVALPESSAPSPQITEQRHFIPQPTTPLSESLAVHAPQIPVPPSTIEEDIPPPDEATQLPVASTSNDPLKSLPEHRRGWWKTRPPTPPEIRERPTHPATQLVLMSSLMVGIAILFQLLMISIL